MDVVAGTLSFDAEVDDARWVTPGEAKELLSYPRDADLIVAMQGGASATRRPGEA